MDVANVIYRHLFQIRDAQGEPYRNRDGVMIGHLIGLCNEVSILQRAQLRPVFVFDGKTPRLKEETERKRQEETAKRGFGLDPGMKADMQRALTLLGTPWVCAPEEAEAQAAHMTSRDCFAALTNDYDALLFGASRMIRSLSGGIAEICILSEALEEFGVDRRGLVDVAILVGTDYNQGGIRGVGPKRALRLVQELGSLDAILEVLDVSLVQRERLHEIEGYYLDPPVTTKWEVAWGLPDVDEALDYLVGEMKLDRKSIERLISRIEKTRSTSRGSRQTQLST